MADGAVALEAFEIGRREHLRNQPHSFVDHERRVGAAGGHDPGALLAAMLKGKETVVGQQGGILMAIDGKDAAFMFGSV